ncbi:MAG: HlyD family efflux transporter periplasmic adaptor subunit, partial [Bacteroidota bacterium]
EEYLLSIKAAKSAFMNQITLILPDLKTDYPESFPQWQSYLDKLSLEEPLPALPEPKDDRERYFISARNLYNQYYKIQSQEIRAKKYVIKAPFSGKVSSSQINTGTLVRTGQKLGEFVNPYSYEMEAAVSLGDLTYVRPGSTVQLSSNDIKGTWTGRVARISDVVDPNTQTAKLFINVSGKDLRDGMYIEGYVKGRTLTEVIEVDRGVLLNDSMVLTIADIYQGSINQEGDSTAIAKGPQVTRGSLSFTRVTPVQFTKKSVFIKGLKDGTYLVNEPLANAYDGMEVALYQGNAQ